MYCQFCGLENNGDAKFCRHCGELLEITTNKDKTKKDQKQRIIKHKSKKHVGFKVLIVFMVAVVVSIAAFVIYNGGIFATKLIIEDRYYLYFAEQQLEQHELNGALDAYRKITDKQAVNDFYFDLCYAYGEQYYNEKKYEDAIKWFEYIERSYVNYRNVKDSIKAAKYGYINENKDNDNKKTFDYLKELKKDNYENSDRIYEDLYSWKVAFKVNHSETDEETNKTPISNDERIYFHVVLSGGEPSDSTELRYEVHYPDGDIGEGEWDYAWRDGKSGWVSVKTSLTGMLVLKILDSDNNLIGEKSIKVTD